MNVMANPGVDKADFELWSLAVSAVNGCGMCMDAHEKVVLQHGVSQAAVQAALRIAAVVHAAAATLDGEAALAAYIHRAFTRLRHGPPGHMGQPGEWTGMRSRGG